MPAFLNRVSVHDIERQIRLNVKDWTEFNYAAELVGFRYLLKCILDGDKPTITDLVRYMKVHCVGEWQEQLNEYVVELMKEYHRLVLSYGEKD